jgi:hypothetical protein
MVSPSIRRNQSINDKFFLPLRERVPKAREGKKVPLS